MDTTKTNLRHLFEQLGLDSHPEAITTFIVHHRMDKHTPLTQAAFWTASQKDFIQEALDADAQWTDVIERLDTQLRKPDAVPPCG
ncbi:MAG: DUF2789 family protein [Shewanella sp.]